ncbi:MAG: hypothetical protein IT324_10295 [Anaerolineae bacterium]|nr:hypothetical protein [Anaerolineae bacterium]
MRSPFFRRALINGLVAGGVIIFFVLIGIPGGISDVDGLPAWFVWGLFILVTAVLAYRAVRPHNIVERRNQTVPPVLISGLITGLVAAALMVLIMLALNAFQLWELRQTPESTTLASGLRSSVTRVQDIFYNVSPRTTAVMAGLPLDAIKPPGNTPRADPTADFFKMAILLVIAGVVGGGLHWIIQGFAERREQRAKGVPAAPQVSQPFLLRWLPIALPLVLFALIVLNSVSGGTQLVGLILSFLLIASGLLAMRSVGDEQDTTTFPVRAMVLVVATVILVVVGLAAPMRAVSDMLFSPKPPDAVQVTGPDGQVQVITKPAASVDVNTLFTYRQLAIAAIGVLFVVGNILSARGRTPLRKLLATNVLLVTLVIAPLFLDKYQQSVLLLVGINVLLGLGLNIVVGYAGLLDLGYVAFFAIGAYVYAFLSSNQDVRNAGTVVGLKYGTNDLVVENLAASVLIALVVVPIVITIGLRWWRGRAPIPANGESPLRERPRWLSYALVIGSVIVTLIVIALLRGTSFYETFADFPAFIMGILIGMMVAAFAGVLLGIPVLRLRGDYLAIVTLGFGEIIRLFLNNLRDITGGPQGVVSIPHANIGSVEIGSNEGLLYLVLAGCILVAFLSLRLKSSRLGRAWGALKSEEDIAQAMGINLVSTKVLAFAIGAAFAGIGGVIFAARQANIFPDNFTLATSINVLSLIIIGGMGSVPGVIVGALVLIGVPESLRVFESYRVMAFGALLVTMMLLRPGGLLPEPPQLLEGRARALAAKEGAQ